MSPNADSEARYLALVQTCLRLLPEMPTGYEITGQDCETTNRMGLIREWRSAVLAAARDTGMVPPNGSSEAPDADV